MCHMSTRKRTLLLAIAAAGLVAALSGAALEGCVAIGFAVEAYLVCSAYLLPATGGDDNGGGPDDPPADPAPTDPSRPGVATAPDRERVLVLG